MKQFSNFLSHIAHSSSMQNESNLFKVKLICVTSLMNGFIIETPISILFQQKYLMADLFNGIKFYHYTQKTYLLSDDYKI